MTTQHTSPLASLVAKWRGGEGWRHNAAWYADELDAAIAQMCDVALEGCYKYPFNDCATHYQPTTGNITRMRQGKFTQQEAN